MEVQNKLLKSGNEKIDVISHLIMNVITYPCRYQS